MNLKEQYEQETGKMWMSDPSKQGYIEWLESKLQTPQPEVSEEDITALFEAHIGAARVYKMLQPKLFDSCLEFGKAIVKAAK